MVKELVCIVCPKGCNIKVNTTAKGTAAAAGNEAAGVMHPVAAAESAGTAEISGYGCKRGLQYALNECTHPIRTLTTTIRVSGNDRLLVPVKSGGPLPKNLLFDCMKVINSHTATVPLKVGDVIIENILDTGIDIVSAANCSGEENVWTDGISSHWIREPQVHGR